jgi:hypothetical protein
MSSGLSIFVATICLFCAASAADLSSYNVVLNETTVSGVSSGAYMATQLHFAFSSNIKGSGVFAGGPYLCAMGDVDRALSTCMLVPVGIVVPSLEVTTDSLSITKFIDDTDNLKGAKAFIYSG